MRRILCLWLPSWPVQRLLAARPELRQGALVLYAQRPRRGECVVACCPAAQSRGIHPDMPLSEAVAMTASVEASARRDPLGLHCEPHDSQADRTALEQLAEACDRFSPFVGLEASDEPECLLLDITGLAPLFSGEESLADQVAEMCRQRGYRPQIAVADTVGAAWAIAHYGAPPVSDEVGWDQLAHASEGKSADLCRTSVCCSLPTSRLSVTVIPPGQLVPALAPLPVAALRLAEETVALLRGLGIVFVAQLADLPREGLQSRFGPPLVERLDQALGMVPEVIVARHAAPEPAATWSLEYPTAHRETLRQVLALLVRRVLEPLAARGQGVLELVCELVSSSSSSFSPSSSYSNRRRAFEDNGEDEDDRKNKNRPGVSLHVGLFQPTALAEHLLELVDMQLELLRLPGAVSRVAVWAARTAPLLQRQHELFAGEPRARGRQLAVLVDRLSSRLGQEHVVRPRPRAEAQPEAAFRYESLTKVGASPRGARGAVNRRAASRGDSSRRGGSSPGPAASVPIAPRPLRLFFPPLPVEVVAVVPDGPPARMRFEGQSHPLVRHWGPERIETAWWRGRSVRRDYYRVETLEGSRFWVFRRLTDGQWFLHGEFE
jgi:protein ImuB